jgi:hypothetical protein
MRTRKNDLLTEINIMRSMMGLRESRTLIMEQGIIGLAKAFMKSATELAVKSADNLMDEIMGGVGSMAAAARMKTMVDDLDVAVKAGDEVAMKAVITNLVNSADFGAGMATKLADDMFADTAADALNAVLTKRANSLKGGGLTDDAIRMQLKDDVATLLSGLPERLVSAAKTKADDAIKWGGKGETVVKSVTKDEVLASLAQSSTWRTFTQKFPEEIAAMTAKIEVLISAGAKTADEVSSVLIKQAAAKLKPTTWSRIKSIFVKYPKLSKGALWLIGLGILNYTAGEVGLWNKIKLFGCELWAGATDDDCKELKAALEDAEKELKQEQDQKKDDNNKTVTGKCDKTEADFKTWASTNVGTDNVTFNQTSCMGSVKDKDGNVIASFTWDGTAWK